MYEIMNASTIPPQWIPGVRQLIAGELTDRGRTAPPSPSAAASPSGVATQRKRRQDSDTEELPGPKRATAPRPDPPPATDIEQRLRALEQFMRNGTERVDIYDNQQPPPPSANYEPPQ